MMGNQIKDWRERAGLKSTYQITCASSVEQAMQDEINDLRMALTQQGAAVERFINCVPSTRDREADRCAYPDHAFNAWLDEKVDDAGNTQWQRLSSTRDAWDAWRGRGAKIWGPAIQARDDAWEAVCAVLSDVDPGWEDREDRGVDAAISAIKTLAAPSASTREAEWLLPHDLAALKRFHECATDFDSGGHDVSKARTARLVEIGALRSVGFGRHMVTSFGDYVLGKASASHAEFRKPLKTLAEYNASPSFQPQQNTPERTSMNLNDQTPLPAIGTAMEGGFFAGVIRVGVETFGIIVSPAAAGEFSSTPWNDSYKDVPGALSYNDGLENTIAMAEAGSDLAQKIRGLREGGFEDWYLPSRDELELVYRNLKPFERENYASFRDGENPSSVPPGFPYTKELPMQTVAAEFKDGGAQALQAAWYWSSTQYAPGSRYAWFQYFNHGGQDVSGKDYAGRARAVRRFKI